MLFRSKLGTLGYGFFVVNDSIHKEIMTENDYSRPYYLLAKESRKRVIVEPYLWSYSGYQHSFFGTSVSLPLIYRDEFLGVIGIDIDLNFLRQRINEVRLYKSGYLTLISNGGTLVSHIDTTFQGKNIFSIINDPDSSIFLSISEGKQLTLETKIGRAHV